MVKLNTLEQYDVATTWFTICSIGAVFSIVFSIMGIKWWFRKRVTFEQDANLTASGNRRPQQEISVVTTGIYRSTLNEDDLLDLSERTKILPPIKVKPKQGPPIVLPRKQKPVPESSLYSRYPEPEEVISVQNSEARLPLSPPPTPINSIKEDLSKPVVLDVYIPDEQIGEIRTENELKIPEIHQRLSIKDVENLSEPPDYAQVVKIPKPRTRISLQAQASEHEPLRKSKQEPEYETLQFLKTKNNNVGVKHDELTYESDKSNIKEQEKIVSESIAIKPKLTMESREDPISSSLELNEFEEFIENERKIMESHFEQTMKVSDPEQINDTLQKSNVKTHLSYVDTTTIDATKIESPKPKKTRKGILKHKKAPPVPIEPIVSVQEDEIKPMMEEEHIVEKSNQKVATIDDAIDIELRRSKEVSFRDRESFIPSKSFSIDETHHEKIIQEESIQEDKKFNDKRENVTTPSMVDVVTAEDGVTIVVIGDDTINEDPIVVSSIDKMEETVSTIEPAQVELDNTLTIPINIEKEIVDEEHIINKDGLESIETNKDYSIHDTLDEHYNHVDDSEENINTKINEEVKIENLERESIKRESISDTDSEQILFDKNQIVENTEAHSTCIVEVEDENIEITVGSKEFIPKPKPRQIKIVNQDNTLEIVPNEPESMVKDNWEPQTIVHNNQVLVMTPPPKYAPPTLPNSFLSDEEEDETDEERNETDPPKPPPRVRIYVINSDEEQKNIKSILKTRIPSKNVSFDHGVPDLIPRTPDTPTSIDMIDGEISDNVKEDPPVLLVPSLSELQLEADLVSNESVKYHDAKDLLDDENFSPISEILQPQVVTKPRIDSRSDSIDEEDLIDCKIKEIQELLHNATSEDVQNSISQPFLLLDSEENDIHEDPIKSPLDEKIEVFKNLTEKMNLSSSLLINLPHDDQHDDEKLLKDTLQSSTKNKVLNRNYEISRAMSEDSTQKSKSKYAIRQMSAPVVSPKDALMAEIRAFGEKRKLNKKEEEQQIKKVVPVLQLEEDIEAQI